MFRIEAKLTASKKHNFVTCVEFSKSGEDRALVISHLVDKVAKKIVEDLTMFGKIKLRLHVYNQYGERLETLKFSTIRHTSGDYPYFKSEV